MCFAGLMRKPISRSLLTFIGAVGGVQLVDRWTKKPAPTNDRQDRFPPIG